MKVGYARFPNPNVFDIAARDIGNQVRLPPCIRVIVARPRQQHPPSDTPLRCRSHTIQTLRTLLHAAHMVLTWFLFHLAVGFQVIAPVLVLLATIFNFVVQLNQLVQEKELKLKLLLRISGVRDTAMWISWWTFFIGYALILSIEWYASPSLTEHTEHSLPKRSSKRPSKHQPPLSALTKPAATAALNACATGT